MYHVIRGSRSTKSRAFALVLQVLRSITPSHVRLFALTLGHSIEQLEVPIAPPFDCPFLSLGELPDHPFHRVLKRWRTFSLDPSIGRSVVLSNGRSVLAQQLTIPEKQAFGIDNLETFNCFRVASKIFEAILEKAWFGFGEVRDRLGIGIFMRQTLYCRTKIRLAARIRDV